MGTAFFDLMAKVPNAATMRRLLGVGSGGGASLNGGIVITGGSTEPGAIVLAPGFAIDAILPLGYTLAGGWELWVSPAGSMTLDVRKSTWPTVPPVASIVAAAPPTITAASTSSSGTNVGWTTALPINDVLRVIVTANSGVTWFQLFLKGTKT